MASPLDNEQSSALEIVLQGHNLLLLGSAGTGKTQTLKSIIKALETNKKCVATTATTGIACSLYENAMTIHKWSGIGDGRHTPEEMKSVIEHNVQYRDVRKRIMETDILILDECSMLSKRMFQSLKEILKLKEGVMQLLFCGDFMQLPPVPNGLYSEAGEFCFTDTTFEMVFPHRVTLTSVKRQQEPELVKAVKETAEGQPSEETVVFIKSLNRALDCVGGSIKLFSCNEQVDEYNRKCITDLQGELYQFTATDEGQPRYLNQILAPKILWIKVGAPVILIRNLSDRLVNGLKGKITTITNNGPVVEFPNMSSPIPLDRIKFTVFSPSKNMDVAVREQFPIKLAFSMTIHKAQGLTLDRVEVDCRKIFKPGQLSVALGRVKSSKNLRVVNFHRQFCKPQPEQVLSFLKSNTMPLMDDRQCCRVKPDSATQTKAVIYTPQDMKEIQELENAEGLEPTEEELFDEEFDRDILAMLEHDTDITLPENLDLDEILENITCKTVVTPMQFNTNRILGEIEQSKYRKFCKQEYAKLSTFLSSLIKKAEAARPISVSEQTEFFSKVHQYHISTEFRMNCMSLFDNEFTEDHLHICFNISVAIRSFLLSKTAEVYPTSSRMVPQRQVTDTSHARIRYIAGYCVAKTLHKYHMKKRTHMYDTSADGKYSYESACCAVDILDSLKVEEHYINCTTSDPYSLIDIERRQNINRSLTNISDSLFSVFLKLTDNSLSMLVEKNLNEKGNDLFEYLNSSVLSDNTTYEIFVNVVSVNANSMCDFEGKTVDVQLKSDLVREIYCKLVKGLLLVMINQFRKDMLDSFNVSKKMAHRKQIQVSTSKKSKRVPSTTEAVSQLSKKRKGQQERSHSATMTQEQATTSQTQEQPSTSQTQEPSTSQTQEQPSTSQIQEQPSTSQELTSVEASMETVEDVESDDDNLMCSVCSTRDKDTDWIQCDICLSWFHRLCAGLKHHAKWKKVTKKGGSFKCKTCV